MATDYREGPKRISRHFCISVMPQAQKREAISLYIYDDHIGCDSRCCDMQLSQIGARASERDRATKWAQVC
jgi:hypothetical protein